MIVPLPIPFSTKTNLVGNRRGREKEKIERIGFCGPPISRETPFVSFRSFFGRGERGSLANESDNKEMESQGWRLIYTRNNTDRMRRKKISPPRGISTRKRMVDRHDYF